MYPTTPETPSLDGSEVPEVRDLDGLVSALELWREKRPDIHDWMIRWMSWTDERKQYLIGAITAAHSGTHRNFTGEGRTSAAALRSAGSRNDVQGPLHSLPGSQVPGRPDRQAGHLSVGQETEGRLR